MPKKNSIKIAIGGKIGSGKTTLSKKINSAMGYNYICIGEVLKNYCLNNQTSPNRKNLHTLSNLIIKQNGEDKKFTWIMKNSPDVNWLQPLIIDGFRSEKVYLQCKKKFQKTILIYCDCSFKTQIKRIIKRDGINKLQATILTLRKIERASKKLRKYADIIFTPPSRPQRSY